MATRWQTGQDESYFVLTTAIASTVVGSILAFIRLPYIISFFATVFACRTFWFPLLPVQWEIPLRTAVRAMINVIYLGNVALVSKVGGPKFGRQFTLQDAFELHNGKRVTSQNATAVYGNYYLGVFVAMLVATNVYRLLENGLTAIAGTIKFRLGF